MDSVLKVRLHFLLYVICEEMELKLSADGTNEIVLGNI